MTPGSTNNPIGLDGIFGGSLRNTFVATWGGGGQVGVWRLAVAVMLLFGARRLAEECYEGVARASGKILPRPPRRLVGQVITLPAGERVAVIAVTAVCFGPRLTFLVLLAWGAVAAGYVLASQLAGAVKLAAAGKLERARGVLPAYRGDGPIAHRIGGVVQGQLPPLPPLLVGLLVTCDLVFLGVADLSGLLIFGPVMAMLLAALGAQHPHDGRLDWLVPALLLTGEGVFLTGLGSRPPRLAAGHLRTAGRGGAAARRPRLPGPGRPGHPGRQVRPGLGRADTAGRVRRRARHRAVRLRGAGRLAVAAGRLGLPRRLAQRDHTALSPGGRPAAQAEA